MRLKEKRLDCLDDFFEVRLVLGLVDFRLEGLGLGLSLKGRGFVKDLEAFFFDIVFLVF